jgi:hypothetical protein
MLIVEGEERSLESSGEPNARAGTATHRRDEEVADDPENAADIECNGSADSGRAVQSAEADRFAAVRG